MVLPNIPRAIDVFITSLAHRDLARMQSLLTSDACLEHEGKLYHGAVVATWGATFFAGQSLLIQAIRIAVDGANAAVGVLVHVNAGAGRDAAVLQMDWHIELSGPLIARIVIGAAAPLQLPAPVSAFMGAMNHADLEGMVAPFAAGALVNDQLQDYWGEAAIRAWAVSDLIGDHVTMAVVKVVELHGNVIVTAHVDGNFDKRGLPEPLVLNLYFSLHQGQIAQLIILHNLTDG